ncbi:MAG: DNA-binding protein [Clostridia bacterium]|nr:DNA-binding protein [Clostridia bacterium]
MFKEYPDVLTVEKLAEALGIGKNKVYELINNRVIGNKRIGRKIVVPKCCLIDHIRSSRYN